MAECATAGCPNPGTVDGVFDDGDTKQRVTYCGECAVLVADIFLADVTADDRARVPDEAGDEDRQRARDLAFSIVGAEPAGWVVGMLRQYAADERYRAEAKHAALVRELRELADDLDRKWGSRDNVLARIRAVLEAHR